MSRIRPSRFVHVVYRTRQFDRMIDWYKAVFDCRVQYQTPVLAFLTYDDEHHRVALINLDPRTPIAVHRGDRIAQLLVQRVELPELIEVSSFDEAGLAQTSRGAGGHGSSGGHASLS